MALFQSSLGTTQPYIPVINATELGKAAGINRQLARADFDTAVANERTNITNGQSNWPSGEEIKIRAEVGTRVWFVGGSAAASHARNVTLPGGVRIVSLVGDANVLAATSGRPSNGTGSDGDVAFDATTGYIFTRASGAWAPTDQVDVPGAPTNTYTSGALTSYVKNGVTFTLNYASGVLQTLVGGGVTKTCNYTSGQLTGTTLS